MVALQALLLSYILHLCLAHLQILASIQTHFTSSSRHSFFLLCQLSARYQQRFGLISLPLLSIHFFLLCQQSAIQPFLYLIGLPWQLTIKNLPSNVGDSAFDPGIQSLEFRSSLEENMANRSSSLSWKSTGLEEAGGLQSVGSQSQT